ncbi:hypothetical protein CR513_20053, partial [Mucuna pruriens]
MWNQTQSRMQETFQRRKINPTLIAFIVDQYLCDNNYFETCFTFRKEASFLISNSSINQLSEK